MALTAALTITPNAFQAGQTPPPSVVLVVGNATAAAVVVTGVELYLQDVLGNPVRSPAANLPLVPIGFGQPASVSANSNVTIGPFAWQWFSVAAGSQFQMVPPSSQPPNFQGSAPLQSQLLLRARVYGSDGSVNEAVPAEFFVSYTVPPPLGFQGGFAQFAGPNNSCLLAVI